MHIVKLTGIISVNKKDQSWYYVCNWQLFSLLINQSCIWWLFDRCIQNVREKYFKNTHYNFLELQGKSSEIWNL